MPYKMVFMTKEETQFRAPQLYQKLGEHTVLIPVAAGTKKPVRKAWQKTRFEETQTAKYQAELEAGNIGVLNGSPSGGLVDIDCDDDQFAEDFAAANLELVAGTLQTKGERGRHFWFRIRGDYPDGVHHVRDAEEQDVGEFRAGGFTVISGTHPSGCAYHILNDKPAMVIEFSEINWPEGCVYPWIKSADKLIAGRVGEPFEEGAHGALHINEQFFAELVLEVRKAVFAEDGGRFYLYDEQTGVWGPMSSARMANQVWEVCRMWIDEQAAEVRDRLKRKFTRRFQESLVALVKSKASDPAFFIPQPHDLRGYAILHAADAMYWLAPNGGEEFPERWPFLPEFRSRHQFSFEFDSKTRCPGFMELLVLVFGDQCAFARRVLGYLLLTGNPGHHIIVIKGSAGSSKSTIVQLLSGILGEQAIGELRTSHLQGRFEMGAIIGKRILYGPDVASDFLSVDGARLLKALTGGDQLSGERKFQAEFLTARGNYNIVITTNNELLLPDGEDFGAWERRLVVLETQAIPEGNREANFARRLLAEEGPAIFTMLVAAAHEAVNDIVRLGHLDVPDNARLSGRSAVRMTGEVRGFVEECLEEGSCPISTRTLHDDYGRWCAENKFAAVNLHKFSRLVSAPLEQLGATSSHSVRGGGREANGYRGLAYKR